jgi:hypothetical protein
VVAGAESLTGTSTATSNNTSAVANGVNTIRFVASGTQTFEGLTAANLVAALNDAAGTGATNYGNLTGALLDPAAFGATLVGNTQKHIVMVENSLNQGEYKVFYLTSTLNAGKTATATLGGAGGAANQFDTTSAQELGTLDFGASINFMLVGSVPYTSYVNQLVDAVDRGLATFDYDANGDGTVGGGEGTTTVPGAAAAPVADNATIVSATQTVTGSGQVLNKAGNMVDVATIKTIEGTATLTATSAQALTMSGVTGAITISDPAGINTLFANAIDSRFSGAVTATISDGTMAALAGLNAGPNAYAITLSETTVAAAALTALDAKTTVVIASGDSGAGSVTGLTGTIAEATAALGAAATNGLEGDETVAITDTSATAASLEGLHAVTSGNIDIATVTALTGTATLLNELYVTNAAQFQNEGDEAVTMTDIDTDNGAMASAVLGATTGAVEVVFGATDAGVILTGFTVGTDKLNLDALTTETAVTTATTFTTGAGKVYFYSAADAGGAFAVETAADVATALNVAWTVTAAATEQVAYIVIVDETEANAAIYKWTDAANTADEVDAAELALIGTVDGQITAANLVFA